MHPASDFSREPSDEQAAIDRLRDPFSTINLPTIAGEKSDRFLRDTNPHKLDLRAGIYLNDRGQCQELHAVSYAREMLGELPSPPAYLPPEGLAEFRRESQRVIFGEDAECLKSGRVATVQTVGASGAFRISCELIKALIPGSKMGISAENWADHPRIARASGVETELIPYFNRESKRLDFEATRQGLSKLNLGDVFLHQVVGHNPTGYDLDLAQSREVIQIAKARGIILIADLVYQGAVEGIEEDAWFVRELAESGLPFMVNHSFSKLMGMYNSRIGSLSVVTPESASSDTMLNLLRRIIRNSYSNPPRLEAAVVTEVLRNPRLFHVFELELAERNESVAERRKILSSELRRFGVAQSYPDISQQGGVYAYFDLSKSEVGRLEQESGVYLVGNGRLCLAALPPARVEYVAEAISRLRKRA